MTHHAPLTRRQQSGNIFAMLFGAVALTGVLAAVGMQTLTGPVTTITRVTQRNVAENNLLMNTKILINAAVTGVSGGDADGDGIIEPSAYIPAGGGETPPTNGGYLPSNLGLALTDPWGTKYGYCVWDHGATNSSAGRITGDNTATAATQPVIAIIAAGPDKQFQTICPAYSGGELTVTKAGGSDDLIFKYTYAEATASSNGLWTLNVTDQAKAELKDSSGTARVSIDRATGIGDFLGVTTDTIAARTGNITLDGGLKFDTEANVTSCGAAEAGTVRYNAAATVLEVCDGAGNWKPTGSDIWKLDGSNVHLKDNAHNVGIGTNTPSQKLDVAGNATISGNITVGGIGNIAGDFTVNTDAFNIDATNKRVAIGKAVPNVALDVNGDSYVLGNGTYTGNLTVDTSTLFVDASNNRMGIGTTTPIEGLHVEGNIAAKSLYLSDDSAANKKSRLYMAGSGQIDLSLNGTAVFSTDASDFTLSKNLVLSFPRQIRLNGAGTTGALNINSWGIPHIVLERDDRNFIEGWNSGRTLQKFAIHGSGGATFGSGVKIGADAVCNASKAGMLAWNASQLQVCDGSAFFNVRSIAKLDDVGDVYLSESGNPEPNNNEVLAWNATDNRWEAKNISTVGSAVATPGGLDKQVQFNDGGTLAGASQLYWDKANNRLSIGTATPLTALHVIGNNGGGAIAAFQIDASSSAVILANVLGKAAVQAQFPGGTVDPIILNPVGGNVGVGTTTPVSKLDVAGGARVGADSTCNASKAGMLAWNSDTLQVCTDAGTFTNIASSSGGASQWVNGASGAISYNDGNVGIGTTSPQSLLHVAGGIQLGDDTGTCPGVSNAKLGTLRFNSGELQVCKAAGWSAVGPDTLASLSCASGQIPKWNGSTWACAADGGGSSSSSVGFIASSSQTLTNTATQIGSYTETRDDGGVFNTATGVFTAPAAGYYSLSATVLIASNGTDDVDVSITAAGATGCRKFQGSSQSGNYYHGCSALAYLTAGQTAFVSAKAGISWSAATTLFQGALIGGGSAAAAGDDGQIQFNAGASAFAADAALHWDNTNKRLGIGTATPVLTLDVYSSADPRIHISDASTGTTNMDGLVFGLDDGNGTAVFKNRENTPMTFWTNNLERMRIDAAGNVGIGTTAPLTALHVVGNNGGGAIAGFQIDASSSAVILANVLGKAAVQAQFPGGAVDPIILNPVGGDVGVGTTTPVSKLDVAGGARVGADSTCNASKAGMLAWNANTLQVCTDAGTFTNIASSSGGASQWVNGASGAISYNDGNVGIGTTSPMAKLEVSSTAGGNRGIYISQYSTDTLGSILLGYKARGSFGAPVSVSNGDTVFLIGASAYDGSSLIIPASERYVVNGTVGAGSVPTDFIISTGSSGNAGGTERLRITSTGNVGIGTTTPETKLDLGGSGVTQTNSLISTRGGGTGNSLEWGHTNQVGYGSTLGYATGGGQPFVCLSCEAGTTGNTFRTRGLKGVVLYSDNAGGLRIGRVTGANADNQSVADSLAVDANGNVGIGTTSPSYKLHVAGQVAGAGAYVNTSDVRLKADVRDLDYGLDTVMRLRPVSFQWKVQKEHWQRGRKLGLIAQETEQVVPEVVTTAHDDIATKSIAYGDLTPILIKAVQELKAANDNQDRVQNLQSWKYRQEIDALKAANDNLRAELRTLQKEINTMRRAQQ